MPTTLTVNGAGYAYPNTGDQQWGSAASAWALAVTNGMLQKAGGAFALTADVNFGPTYGLLSPYFTSTTTNPAAAGSLRLAKTDTINFRNNANTADLPLGISTTDRLTYGGVPIGTFVNVKEPRFGAKGDGVTDDTTAITNAIAAISAGTIFFPAGTYLISSELVLGDNKFLLGEGRNATIIQPSVNSINIVHHTGSNGGVRDLGINGNNKTGISALRITPLSESQTTTVVNQNYNFYQNLYIQSCDEGIVLMAGPFNGGASGCWYNNFYSFHIYYCKRGIWLKDPTNASGSNVNYCRFYGIRIGQGSGASGANTGVQIDAGTGNEFHGLSLEDISHGTSPNATPVSIWIKNASAVGGSANESNRFIGASDEPGSTTSLIVANSRSEFYGCNLSNAMTFTATPLIMQGGYDPSVMPYVHPGFVWQANSQISGYGNNVFSLRGPLVSSSANPAASGTVRLATGDSLGWRNNANSADVLLAKNSSDQLTWAGTAVLNSSGVLLAGAFPALTGDVTTSAGSLSTTLAATQANIQTLSRAAGVTIHGTNTNDNASAGYVGEYISAVQTTYTNVTSSNTFQNAVSISLTAGDWDLTGVISYILNGSTATNTDAALSAYSANTTTDHSLGDNWIEGPSPATGNAVTLTVPAWRVSISSTTTYYWKASATFSAGNPQYKCRLSARRIR